MVAARSFSLLAAIASLATGVAATCTGNNVFEFTALGMTICLPKGGVGNPGTCPDGSTCPDNWYWHKSKELCVPNTKKDGNNIVCPGGFAWNTKKYLCKSVCTKQQFWYQTLETCLPTGGITNPPSPPTGSSCPNKWYWHKLASKCVPKNPDWDTTPDCDDKDVWNTQKQCCVTPPKPSCGRSEFYFKERNCCLPHSGPSTPPPPPSGHQCPHTWYWHHGHGCCVPTVPEPPKPTCPGQGWHWNPKPCWCEPGPQPSHKPHQPHGGYGGHRRRSNTTMCPNGLQACPIEGLFGGEYECLNTKVELESCGGCASTGKGKDCTQIPHAWNVACKNGGCQVFSCVQGYGVDITGTACLPL